MKHLRGTIYSRYGSDGNDSAVWKARNWNSTVEMLAAVLTDPNLSKDDKNRAAAILKWTVEREKTSPDPVVAKFWNDIHASCLWEWSERYQLQAVAGEDGVTRAECVCIAPMILPKPKTQIAAQSATPEPDEEL